MALTDTACRQAKPAAKAYTLSDGKSLFLYVQPTGAKWWRYRYRFNDKGQMFALGTYPDVSLKAAREGCEAARKLLASGINPCEQRKENKAAKALSTANSFEAVTREWHAKQSTKWAPGYSNRMMQRFERDVFPIIGKKPIADLRAPALLAMIHKIEARGTIETAHRAKGDCSQVFRYAIASGRAEQDPTAALKGALQPKKVTHYAAITEPDKAGDLLRTLEGYQGTLTVQCALLLAPLVFVRPGELRHARWADIDLDAGEWRYTVTKTKTEHIVPLATQAIEILKKLHVSTGSGEYVFPSARSKDRAMSNNAVLGAFSRLGIPKDEMSGHGFRAMARTILDEVLGFRPDFIEHQLAHSVKDPNGRAYNRTAHLPARKEMMQKWADYLDGLKA